MESLSLTSDVSAVFKNGGVGCERETCLGAEARNNRGADCGLERGG